MLLYPSVDLLRQKVDSKYTLAVMSAKRARDLIEGKPALVLTDDIKPISIATEEIADDLISYKRGENAVDYPIESDSDAAFSFSAEAVEADDRDHNDPEASDEDRDEDDAEEKDPYESEEDPEFA